MGAGIKYIIYVGIRICFALVLITLAFSYFTSSPVYTDVSPTKNSFFTPVVKKLLKKGADSSFIFSLLSHPNTVFNEKYTDIYVPLGERPQKIVPSYDPKYAKAVDEKAVNKSRDFLVEHYQLLSKCEKIFKVPKEIITSILWVETRHGSYLGGHHVPSVYLSLALADQPEFYRENEKKLLKRLNGRSSEDKQKYIKKLKLRTETKVNWAIDQLIALQKMRKKSPVSINEIRGSNAGAFGISQFIPTSYIAWAIDGNNDKKVNLFEIDDAVYSVANYLKVNGWGDKEYDRYSAIYHYNNSGSYVYAVITLADKLEKAMEGFDDKGNSPTNK